MTLKVGINGFGRIGRMALRSIIENNRKDLEVVAINNRGNTEISSFLLKHDTMHGKLKAKSHILDAKPHSLSYQAETFAILFSTTFNIIIIFLTFS